uniref:Uncharacterized protein n=1 Tax=Ditylenchus dipsaci TaxID=166011 RepID=A0A915D3N5_9BILA
MTRISEELQKNREYAGKQSWFIANMESEHRAETACLNLEKQNSDCLKSINQLNSDLFNVGEKEDVAEQIEMWKGLIQIFEQKIKLHRAKGSAKSTFGDDKAMGDRMYY